MNSILIALVFAFQTVISSQDVNVRALAAQILCTCGCERVLVNCDCSYAEKMRNEIKELLDKKFTPEQVINYYVSQYGEAVLAAPLKKGFNWMAYIIPFLVAFVSVGLIFYFLNLKQKRARSTAPRRKPKEKYREKIKKELENLE